ncbi:hypothetical protein QFZ40_004180 [Arthrobacter pascens]|uniref:hypothetical protein n=1 Tax=Arthrobacter pascens TaxID=1677 RepID=UPI002781E411|nr:hypothetical protein [Arthrobacter pascens]MDQ0636271.1 hypothetical protein [Arthrobacter pascens]
MAKFRGLHVVAGIAAMLVAAFLGSAMKLNNTAVVMSSSVVFVAVAMWADSALTRRRRESLTLQQAASLEQATSLEPHPAPGQPGPGPEAPPLDSPSPGGSSGGPAKREDNAA